ncbi:MAG: hypothetical protein GXP56_16270 [Deltaproteobacteria bacterium]|nr:hypothetical protein [Deltaproteobacteria bacterium]
MKKLIALTFAMLFLGAGIACATDFTLTGSYYVRGSYFDNVQAYTTGGTTTTKTDGINVASFTNYDHELSVDANWKIDDTTKVFARFEMRDETWMGRSLNANEGTAGSALAQLDDNIIVEQVWGSHTFGSGHTLTVGLMSSGAWATSFQDNGSEAYRIKYVAPTSAGTFIGILQKNVEAGSITVGEDNDNDSYILGIITKFGDINVKPLFVYTKADNRTTTSAYDAITVNLALDGTFGNIGFETEAGYNDKDFDTTASTASTDYSTYGAYLNVWMNSGALKVGILGAYGSYDTDANKGHDFGDDFSAGGALIMGDDITFNGSGTDLDAGRLVAVYFGYAVSDQLSIGGYAGYAKCGVDNNGIWDGAKVSEISFNASYAITANLTYKVAAGTAQLTWGNNTPDPDRAVELYHKLSFSF